MGEHDVKLHGIAAGRPSGPCYREDYAAWVAHQLELLREPRLDEIDYDNLIDEVEDLGKSEFRQFRSAIEVVIVHILKWDFQPSHRSPCWQLSIAEHRRHIEQELADGPSFRSRRNEAVASAFRVAPLTAARETGLSARVFPGICPYDWDAILTRPHDLPGDDA